MINDQDRLQTRIHVSSEPSTSIDRIKISGPIRSPNGTPRISQEKLHLSSNEYMRIVNSDEKIRKWYEFLIKLKVSDQAVFRTKIIDLLHQQRNIPQDILNRAEFRFTNVPHISGTKLLLPVLEFQTIRDWKSFCEAARIQIVQGYAMPVRLSPEMREVDVIMVCKEQMPGSMTPIQIEQHEKTHAVDPLLHERSRVASDTIILKEMIATIGEVASKTLDNFPVNTPAEFWMRSYIPSVREFTPEFFQVMKLDPRRRYSQTEIAQAIQKFVHDITQQRRNTELVILLMSCRSFADVLMKLR